MSVCEDVELAYMALARERLDSEGCHADTWTCDWDGEARTIRALRGSQEIRSFRAYADGDLYEADPYTNELARVGSLEEGLLP